MRYGRTHRERRFAIGRKEGPVLGGVLVNSHPDMEGAVDLLHRCACGNNQTVDRSAGDLKTASPRKGNYSRIILFRRAESRGELSNAEKLPVVRARRVIESSKQSIELWLVAQWKDDRKAQPLVFRHRSDELCLALSYLAAHMTVQHLKLFLPRHAHPG